MRRPRNSRSLQRRPSPGKRFLSAALIAASEYGCCDNLVSASYFLTPSRSARRPSSNRLLRKGILVGIDDSRAFLKITASSRQQCSRFQKRLQLGKYRHLVSSVFTRVPDRHTRELGSRRFLRHLDVTYSGRPAHFVRHAS